MVKSDVEMVGDQVEAKLGKLRTVAVINIFLGMVVGVLTVIASTAGTQGHYGYSAGAFGIALVLMWFGIHRTYK